MPDRRRLLYICPEFPPSRATGAIRAARFAAHLPDHGWDPVVLTLRDHRPEVVVPGAAVQPVPTDPVQRVPLPLSPAADDAPPFHSEWLPFGEAMADVPRLTRAGHAAIAAHRPEAIMVNAPPNAFCLTAGRLARAHGLPLVIDHRDPWMPCDQRGPRRPFWTRVLEGPAERRLVKQAAAVILNTERARDAYRTYYPQVLAGRFHAIRNAMADNFFDGPAMAPFPVFTLLYPGSFGPYVSALPVVELARELAQRGLTPEQLRIVLTAQPRGGPAPDEPAARLIQVIDRVPQHAMGPLMLAADMLLAVSQRSTLRLPLKTFDILQSTRPVILFQQVPNPELEALYAAAGAGDVLNAGEITRAADIVCATMAAGRHPERPRDPAVLDPLRIGPATAALAGILDDVTGAPA
ncbi:glycosyltransferase [Pseudooceanicola sp. LIPI14-2-Ac024]|uniref:glycosyltransferase n=1 Tax=Pseudooceanicola sp. LIPI14-2-Ac024 TaxID=3344875 RepID=UPI0035D029BD